MKAKFLTAFIATLFTVSFLTPSSPVSAEWNGHVVVPIVLSACFDTSPESFGDAIITTTAKNTVIGVSPAGLDFWVFRLLTPPYAEVAFHEYVPSLAPGQSVTMITNFRVKATLGISDQATLQTN